MNNVKYLTKEGFRNLRVNKLMSIASVTVLFSCLMIMGIAFMLLVNIETFITGIESENIIMVYLDTEATDYDYMVLGEKLKALDNVARAEKVDKGPAYEKILSELDDNLREYLEELDENPLPNAYKVTVGDMSGFDEVAGKIKTMSGVRRVYENSSLAKRLEEARKSVTCISAGLISLLLIVSLFIISNTIKVTMFSRRLEISIMKSVGATNSFIRWPFMVEGMIIGVISGVLATGAVWGIYEFASDSFSSILAGLKGTSVDFIDYAPYIALAFVGIGIFTGVFGSAASMRKYLKERKFVEIED